MANAIVRPITDEDAFDVIGLIAACWADYDGCVFAIHEVPHLVAPATAYTSWGGQGWVAEAPGGRIVGTAGMRPRAEGFAELCQLYVHRRMRRSGVGRELVLVAEEAARVGGASRMYLWSDTRFATAHEFYERLGYVRLPGRRALGDLSQSEEFRFEKPLCPKAPQ